jgi:WD40 repeat protein
MPPLLEKVDRVAYRARWAVVIGNRDYTPSTSGLHPASFAVNDAEAVERTLREEFGYVSRGKDLGEVKLLKNATKAQIEFAFTEWLPSKAIDPADCVLVFFAGHGLVAWETGRKPGFLAAIDSNGSDLERSCIAVDWIRQHLADLPCRHKAIILDCCYSGSLFNENVGVNFTNGEVPAGGGNGGKLVAKGFTISGSSEDRQGLSAISYYLGRPAFWGMSASRDTPALGIGGKNDHSRFVEALLKEMEDRCDSERAEKVFTFSYLAQRAQSHFDSGKGESLDTRQIPASGRLPPIQGDGEFLFFPTVERTTPSERARQVAEHDRHASYASNLRRAAKALDYDSRLANELLNDPQLHPKDLRESAWHLLEAASRPSAAVVGQHKAPLHTVILLSDCRRVLTSDVTGRTCVWKIGHPTPLSEFNAIEGREDDSIARGGDSAHCASLDETETLVAVGTRQGVVSLWNLGVGDSEARLVARKQVHDGVIIKTAFLGRSGGLATSSFDGTASVLSIKDLSLQHKLAGHVVGVTAIDASKDGRYVVTGSADGVVCVWKIANENASLLRKTHVGQMLFVGFCDRRGTRFGTIAEGEFGLWDTESGQQLARFREKGVMFKPSVDGESGAFPCLDGTIRVRDLRNGSIHQVLQTRAEESTFSTDWDSSSKTLVTGHGDGTVRIWRTGNEERVRPVAAATMRAPAKTMAFADSDRRVAVGCLDEKVHLLEMPSLQEKSPPLDLPDAPSVMRCTRTSKRLCIACCDGSVLLFTCDRPQVLRQRKMACDGPTGIGFISEDSQVILSFDNGLVLQWGVERDAVRTMVPAGLPILAMEVVPRTDALLIAREKGPLICRRGPGYGPETEIALDIGSAAVWRLAVAAERDLAVAVGTPEFAMTIDLKLLRLHERLADQRGPVRAVAVSPDGRSIASGGDTGEIRLWDATTGQSLLDVHYHSSSIESLQFSADGRFLVSGDHRGQIALWEVGAQPTNRD